jgi:hypothetical protein
MRPPPSPSRSLLPRRLRSAVLLALLPVAAACVQRFQTLEPREVAAEAGAVRTPVRAHMYDGSIVVFPQGATVAAGSITGSGTRHKPGAAAFAVQSVPIDSVIGVETFATSTQGAQSVLVSGAATAALVVGGALLAVALFGSCPTFYADSAGTPVLQAEAFSYAIAPMFEHRDTDRLRLSPGPDGVIRLEVRNEALETHYLNHLELLEVVHAPGETVVSGERGSHIGLGPLIAPSEVRNAAGLDATASLLHEDGDTYATPASFAAARSVGDLNDYLEFTVGAPPGSDSVAILLRLRNSLLNTVLLYDEMLAGAGPQALDWVGEDLTRISTALELAELYTTHMGMRVEVLEAGTYKQVARIWDVGPIAFHDVAALVPVGADGRARVRLSFVADNWRIDRLAWSPQYRRATARLLPISSAVGMDGSSEDAALRSLSEPDEDYLVTTPGQRFIAAFDAGTAATDAHRTFFLASQGYYSEWMRPDWLRTESPAPFVPSADRIHSALTRWLAKRDAFEQQFYASKIPVR